MEPIRMSMIEEFLDDGIDNAANKILEKLNAARNKRKSSAKRCIWEMMQNAKDVYNSNFGGVSIEFEIANEHTFIFRHNGRHFTMKNVRSLIQQVSSKSSTNSDENVTGMFGTGFICTHLIADVIDVKGILIDRSDKYRSFSLRLDRSGSSREEIAPRIKDAIMDFVRLDSDTTGEYYPFVSDYTMHTEKDFDTSFTYHMETEAQLQLALLGLSDLMNTLPVTMINLPTVKSVRIINRLDGTDVCYTCTRETKDCKVSLSNISNGQRNWTFLSYQNQDVALSVEIREKDGELEAIKRDSNAPVLLRDFPLIGSHRFHFPFYLNGFRFIPTEPRDDIQLHGDDEDKRSVQNRLIMEKAVEAALEFNLWLIDHKIKNRYLLASSRIPETTEAWDEETSGPWIKKLQRHWRESLLKQNLLETDDSETLLENIIIPEYKKSEIKANSGFYDFLIGFIDSGCLPLREQLAEWTSVINKEYESWGLNLKYTKEDFFEDLQRVGCVKNLGERLGKTQEECYDWLNSLYSFVVEQGDVTYLDKYPVVPNQMGDFCMLTQLSSDSSKRIPNRLKEIGNSLLGKDFYVELVSESIDDKIFNNIERYSLDNLIDDMNKIIREKMSLENFVSSSDWTSFSNGVYGLISLTTNGDSDFVSRRNRMYQFVSHFAESLPQKSNIDSLPEGLWTEADKFVVKYVPRLITSTSSDLNSLGENFLKIPNAHSTNECTSWINEYGELTKMLGLSIPSALNIYPNQKGTLKSLQDLHYDDAIPEEIKDLFIVAYNSDKRAVLLDNRITGYEKHNVLSTKDIYDDIKEMFESRNTSDTLRLAIAREAIALIPSTQKDSTSDCMAMYNLAKAMDSSIKDFVIVENTNGFYWNIFIAFLLNGLCKNIAESVNVKTLSEKLHKSEEDTVQYVDDVIEYAETRFGKNNAKFVETEHGVWINQNDDFCMLSDIRRDDNVEEDLKDLAKNEIVDIDYREKMLRKGMKCESYVPQASVITAKNILAEINEALANYVEDKKSLQDPNFAELVFKLDRLIKKNEDYKTSLSYFVNNHDKLIVGSIGDEKTLSIVGALVSSPETLELINEINKFGKEALVEVLRHLNTKRGDSSGIIECTSRISGALAKISLSDTPYADLSENQRHDALMDAKMAVQERLEGEGYEFTEGLCENDYGNIYGVKKDGVEYPLVVHSYKNNNRPFQLTAFDWEQLAKPNSMLWVNTSYGVRCVPFYALAKDRGTINISFDSSNFDIADRSKALAAVLKYYKGLHFDFGSMLPSCTDNIEMFNNPEKPIHEALGAKSDDIMF